MPNYNAWPFEGYNWPFEGKNSANMALSENEFDNLLQCSRMSESRD